MSVIYDGEDIEAGYRLDLLIENVLINEIRAVEALTRLHDAQLLTYLKIFGKPLGHVINFNVPLLKHGLRRLSHSTTLLR